MKSFGTILDQSLQLNTQFIQLPLQSRTAYFLPQQSKEIKSAQSYAAVLEQSIVTQDKPLVKEILINSDYQMLVNTVSTIQVAKVVSLLKLLEQILLQDSSYTHSYVLWIKELIKRHLGILVSNPENKQIVLRLRRWIEKRVFMRQNLCKMISRLPKVIEIQFSNDFKPKFMYYEEQQNPQQNNIILPEEQSFLAQQMDYELDQ